MRFAVLAVALFALGLAATVHAAPETGRWVEMGKGEYGPMRAMMLGRLGFTGPMVEAMGNMAPFENFLLLVGKVPSETKACPAN